MKQKIYIFSGLGADERVFKQLNFSNLEPVFIDWIEPFENETLESYAKRISEAITSENPIILGISFGGMLAVEISKIRSVKKLFLIATAKTYLELPKVYRILGRLGVLKLIPLKFLKRTTFVSHYFFGTKAPEDKLLLKAILKDTDPTFLKWALKAIIEWRNAIIPSNYLHFHGTNDKIISIKNVAFPHKIAEGGHLMTLDHFEELNCLLQKEFNDLN